MKNKSVVVNPKWSALVLALGVACPGSAQTVITQSTTGTFPSQGSGFYLGQSATTPAGNSWDNLSFSFDASGTPYANGELFLLSSAYAGAPSGLSSSTTGYVASTTDIESGEWVFAPDVTLDASTQYYFYDATAFSGTEVLYAASDVYSGGEAFQANDSSGPFYAISSADINFTLSATDVPEPGVASLAGLALVGFGALRARFRRA
jgi:hypothetical protein